ncbi:MAG: FmdB family zinc ribbon protein [bacterium]
MPTYTYRCPKCGHEFDLFHSMSDTGRKKCEKCGATAKRMIGAGAGLVFKGSGFYITDYKHGHGTAASNGINGHDSNGNGTAPKPDNAAKDSKASEPKKAEAKGKE